MNYLHFEACYYKAIEYCIDHGITYMEPGAGELLIVFILIFREQYALLYFMHICFLHFFYFLFFFVAIVKLLSFVITSVSNAQPIQQRIYECPTKKISTANAVFPTQYLILFTFIISCQNSCHDTLHQFSTRSVL